MVKPVVQFKILVRCAILMILGVSLFFSGCAGVKSSAKSSALGGIPARDSLRAKFVLTVVGDDGKMQDLDAVLFSVPGERYRLELTGALGIGIASLLWTKESWQVSFPTEKLYVKGQGYMVGLMSNNTLPMVHIHQVADLFDGILLPEKFEEKSSRDSAGMRIVDAAEPNGRLFKFASADGKTRWLSRVGRDGKEERLRFENFKEMGGVEIPSRITFEKDGEFFLSIVVKKVARKKEFSSGVWRLNIPKSFKPID